MATNEPAVWSDFLTAISQITAVLIIVCALAGPAQPYIKGEEKFVFIKYIVEVITSALSGVIVFLLLRVIDMPEEWLAAFTGIGTFFGLKLMNVFYRILVGRLKVIFQQDDEKKKEAENGKN